MTKDLVSVIIPFYHSEVFFEECLDSVLRQSYERLEILLVSDGADAASLGIAKQYAQKDARVRLLQREHGGVSAARNAAIDAAEGEYVLFVDSDDLIHERLVELEQEQLSASGADMISVPYRIFNTGAGEEPQNFPMEQFRVLNATTDQAMELLASCLPEGVDPNISDYGGIGGKMFRRETLNELRFDTSYRQGEDTLLLMRFILQGRKILYANVPLYYYRRHEHNSSGVLRTDLPIESSYLGSSRVLRDTALKGGWRRSAESFGLIMTRRWRKYCMQAAVRRERSYLRQLRGYYLQELTLPGYWLKKPKELLKDLIVFLFPLAWGFLRKTIKGYPIE